jgi:hypothetical protein
LHRVEVSRQQRFLVPVVDVEGGSANVGPIKDVLDRGLLVALLDDERDERPFSMTSEMNASCRSLRVRLTRRSGGAAVESADFGTFCRRCSVLGISSPLVVAEAPHYQFN